MVMRARTSRRRIVGYNGRMYSRQTSSGIVLSPLICLLGNAALLACMMLLYAAMQAPVVPDLPKPTNTRLKPPPLPAAAAAAAALVMNNKSKTSRLRDFHRPLSDHDLSPPCGSSYKGVLHIQSGDKGAAAGTLFFQYIINQLIFAEQHQLIPWVYLNNVSQHAYDADVHGKGSINITCRGFLEIRMSRGLLSANITKPWPDRVIQRDKKRLPPQNLTFLGTGVWQHYFKPVSAYDPNHPSCQNLPMATLEYDHLTPSMQFFAPWAVRSWEYTHLPNYLKSKGNLKDWYQPQRIRAHKIVQKHYRFRDELQLAAEDLVPDGTRCLAVHIRHSDKAGIARRKLEDTDFIPYVEAYVHNGGDKVYLATDSSRILGIVQSRTRWSVLQNNTRLITQDNIVRSSVRKPVFNIGAHHRTNHEILVEILAMSRCQFMVHGFSAVSESAIYLNLDLHNNSADLEDPNHVDADAFGQLVKSKMRDFELPVETR